MKLISRDLTPIQRLWNRHYIPEETECYHGDMAKAFERMLADADCYPEIAAQLWTSIHIHCRLERKPSHTGRKWFCETFYSSQS